MENFYMKHFRNLLKGKLAKPRAMEVTYELNQTVRFFPGTVVRRPGDNPAIGLMELVQFIAGEFNHKAFEVCAPNSRLDLFTEQMAYGPRAIGQFERVIDELRRDPDSRRAVVMIAFPDDTVDIMPCTLSMQFHTPTVHNSIRHLIASVTMRSSDTVWGLPYDIIQYGGVIMAIANCLHMTTAQSTIFMGNAHIYTDTMPKKADFDDRWAFSIPTYRRWEHYQNWARAILKDLPDREELMGVFKVKREGQDGS